MMLALLLLLLTGLAAWSALGGVGPQAGAATPLAEQQRLQAVAELERTLDAGQEAIVLDDSGRQRTARWLTQRERGPLPFPVAGYCDLQSFEDLCLLELLPDPRHTHYVLSAQVRISHLAPLGKAGLCFLYEEAPVPPGRVLRFLSLTLAEQNGRTEGVARLGSERQQDPLGPGQNPRRDTLLSLRLPKDSLTEWHTLSIRVTPDELTAHHDDTPIGTVKRKRLEQSLRSLEPGQPAGAVVAPPALRGRLGLYVSDGRASFRNVVVRPLRLPTPAPKKE
jgi:hypothetical protein